MRILYKMSSQETGTVVIRRRKIAKALRWWLRKNGYDFTYSYFSVDSCDKTFIKKDISQKIPLA